MAGQPLGDRLKHHCFFPLTFFSPKFLSQNLSSIFFWQAYNLNFKAFENLALGKLFFPSKLKVELQGCFLTCLLSRPQEPANHHFLGRGSEAGGGRRQHHHLGLRGAHRLCQYCHQAQQPASVRAGHQVEMTRVCTDVFCGSLEISGP